MNPRPPAVTFVAFPKFIVTWPLIVMSFVLPALSNSGIISEHLMAESWIATFAFVIVALGFDFTSLWMTIIFLMNVIILISMMLITVTYHVPIFETIRQVVDALALSISTDVLISIGFLLSVLYLSMLIISYLNHRWVVSDGSMERIKFLLRSKIEHEVSNRRRVGYEILDVMEYILTFGGGHLTIDTDEHTKKHIGLVLFVRSVDQKIDAHEVTPTSSS